MDTSNRKSGRMARASLRLADALIAETTISTPPDWSRDEADGQDQPHHNTAREPGPRRPRSPRNEQRHLETIASCFLIEVPDDQEEDGL